jgi:cytochrome c5
MAAVALGAIAVAGCRNIGPEAGSEPGAATAAKSMSAASDLEAGEAVWKENCEKCHGAGGLGDAPSIGDKAAWSTRVDQGNDVLLQHALEGFVGSIGEMPSRGGNPSLSDDQVRAALEFMVRQVR